MMSELIIDKIEAFANELLPSIGLELVEVQFRREQHGWVLRIFIDAEEGINHEHCRQVSREIGDFLDVEDLIDHAYHLEISSPGLERKLNKIEDYSRFVGRNVKVKLHQAIDDMKVFEGEIAQVDGDTIVLDIEGGKRLELSFEMISRARLAI